MLGRMRNKYLILFLFVSLFLLFLFVDSIYSGKLEIKYTKESSYKWQWSIWIDKASSVYENVEFNAWGRGFFFSHVYDF
jgi:hypothetical protein